MLNITLNKWFSLLASLFYLVYVYNARIYYNSIKHEFHLNHKPVLGKSSPIYF